METKKYSKAAVAGLFVVAVVLGALPALNKPKKADGPVSGEFSGTAQGLGGDVTVTITLTDGVITDVVAVGDSETPGIGTMALDELPGAMVEKNSIEVDTVSGATVTSEAILEAAKAAMTEAGLN